MGSPSPCTGPGRVVLVVACLLVATLASAAAYRYRDANGQWVYTDRPPTGNARAETLELRGGARPPRMTVVPRSTPSGVALYAVNECPCPVEFAVRVDGQGSPLGAREVVPPRGERLLLEVPVAGPPAQLRFEYGYVIGAPDAEHRPAGPYRAPYAQATAHTVSQAPPDAVTHSDASSRHAVDIAMPVGTAVHAAREGVVINVARNHHRGGLQPRDADQANFVQVLHDDGTHAVYAHLQLDSVRVRPGQRVARGEYLANSGNTGYSTGPHLHFVVLRNAGLRSESVPVTFAGQGGAAVTPRTGQQLVAY
jgi:murein DD-endopeptidase MepM/ murein hydrolase activator NlpD